MTRWVSFSVLLATLTAAAEGPADKLTVAGVAEFDAAYQAWDRNRFTAAADLFRQATTNSVATATNFYWLGVAEFHLLLHLQNSPGSITNRAAATGVLDAALAALTSAVKLDGHHAETHALLGTLHGMKIGDSPLRALRFGPRVARHRSLALKYGATNPRVQYLLGTCQFHTAKKPAAWREALTTFLAAEKLFDAEARTAPGPLDPRWGHSSCLTFIGRTYEQLGQRREAAAHFRKALALHPADHLAKEGLARVEANP